MDAAEDRPIPAWPPARWLLLAFAALLALFYLTRPAPIQWGDGLELAAVSSHLGVAHPTGYPLFTLLGWIAEKLPVYTPYARLLLLGRLFSCATVLAIALLIRTRLRAAGLTDRAATQGILDVVVATADQMDKITALDSDDEPVQEIRITSADDLGLVLVRGLVPTRSERADVERLLRTATCEAESLDK